MSDIEFVDELPAPGGEITRGGKPRWSERVKPLMEHPGQWAIIDRYDTARQASNAAGNLKHGRVSLPPGKWDFVSRKVDGEYRVYGRFGGGDA